MLIYRNKDFNENFCYIPSSFFATKIVLKTNNICDKLQSDSSEFY